MRSTSWRNYHYRRAWQIGLVPSRLTTLTTMVHRAPLYLYPAVPHALPPALRSSPCSPTLAARRWVRRPHKKQRGMVSCCRVFKVETQCLVRTHTNLAHICSSNSLFVQNKFGGNRPAPSLMLVCVGLLLYVVKMWLEGYGRPGRCANRELLAPRLQSRTETPHLIRKGRRDRDRTERAMLTRRPGRQPGRSRATMIARPRSP